MKARPSPLITVLCLLCILLCLLATGCASTDQAMTSPPNSQITLRLEGVAPAGPVIVVNNAQVGVTSKPFGMDALNPAVSAAAQQNSGTTGSNATAGPVDQTKPSVLPTSTAAQLAAAAKAKAEAEAAAKEAAAKAAEEAAVNKNDDSDTSDSDSGDAADQPAESSAKEDPAATSGDG